MSATLRMERTYAAPARAVFDGWTSEDVLRRWFHAGHDWATPEASVDLRVGGALPVVMRNPHNLLDEAALRDHEDAWGKTFDNLRRVLEAP